MLIDNVRDSVQRVLPSTVFGRVFGLYSSVKTAANIGITDCRRLRDAAKAAPSSDLAEFHFPGTAHPVYVRPGTTDADIVEAALVRQYHDCLTPTFPVSLIIDAGAYAGYTSVFFANKYPNAQIIALEPDAENYALAKTNLAPYLQVQLLNAAVWYRSGQIQVLSAGRFDSTSVTETSAGGYPCIAVDLETLLKQSGHPRISIFKCDIEGAEEFLFSHDAGRWIDQTDSIMMEIHNPQAHQAVYSALRRPPFKVFTNRELHVFYRIE